MWRVLRWTGGFIVALGRKTFSHLEPLLLLVGTQRVSHQQLIDRRAEAHSHLQIQDWTDKLTSVASVAKVNSGNYASGKPIPRLKSNNSGFLPTVYQVTFFWRRNLRSVLSDISMLARKAKCGDSEFTDLYRRPVRKLLDESNTVIFISILL